MMHLFNLLLLLSLFLSACPALAGVEIEPNNRLEQATQVNVREQIEGLLDDEVDVYRVSLPSPASIQILVDAYPVGANLELAVIGFGPKPLQEKALCQSNGGAELRCRVDATEISGYLRLNAHFSDPDCSGSWCGAQLASDGPFITLKGALGGPKKWQGNPVSAPPIYRIRVLHPALAKEGSAGNTADRKAQPEPKLAFAPKDWPGGFDFPKTWTTRWQVRDQIARFQPQSPAAVDILIRAERRLKNDYTGSSAERQLNLAERDISVIGGSIHERGEMIIAQRPAPFLVATLPALDRLGNLTPFGQLQIVMEFSEAYLLLSYRAPVQDYPRYLGAFQQVLESFRSRTPFASSHAAE